MFLVFILFLSFGFLISFLSFFGGVLIFGGFFHHFFLFSFSVFCLCFIFGFFIFISFLLLSFLSSFFLFFSFLSFFFQVGVFLCWATKSITLIYLWIYHKINIYPTWLTIISCYFFNYPTQLINNSNLPCFYLILLYN